MNKLPNFNLQNIATPLAQKIFFKYQGEKKAIHPKTFFSKNLINLNHFPKADEWKSIFHMFPFKSLLEYATYFAKIRPYLSQDQVASLLQGYGLQANIKDERELIALTNLKPILKQLFSKKNIPLRSLFFLDPLENKVVEELVEIISATFLKNKVVKEIIELFADLHLSDQKLYLQRINKVKKNTSKDGLVALNERFKNILYSLRFPARERMEKKMYESLKIIYSQYKNIKVTYDNTFERDTLSLKIEIHSQLELNKLQNLAQDQTFREIIIKSLEILKNP